VLDVRKLAILREVVAAGSITGAARRLNYAPSAVSQLISALEREVGIPLLERVGRGVRPTAAGLLLVDHTRDILARLQAAEAAVTGQQPGRAGRIVVAAFPTAGAALMPAAVQTFRQAHPAVAVSITIAEADDAVAAVVKGRAQLALVVVEGVRGPIDQALTQVPLAGDPFCLVLNKGHRLAGHSRIDLREFADEPWVTASRSSTMCEEHFIEACAAAGFQPTSAVEADDYVAAQAYVAEGVGVAMVPQMALATMHDGVVVRRVLGDEPQCPIGVVVRASDRRNPVVTGMVRALEQACISFAAERHLAVADQPA